LPAVRLTPPLTLRVPYVPTPATTLVAGAYLPLFVKIWITPPIASEPYKLLNSPGTTSIRSI